MKHQDPADLLSSAYMELFALSKENGLSSKVVNELDKYSIDSGETLRRELSDLSLAIRALGEARLQDHGKIFTALVELRVQASLVEATLHELFVSIDNVVSEIRAIRPAPNNSLQGRRP